MSKENVLFALLVVFFNAGQTTEAVIAEERGIQPEDISQLNDNSTSTCSKFLSGETRHTQLFKQSYCNADHMSVTIVGLDMECGQDLYAVGLSEDDVDKPLNRWKTCRVSWHTTSTDNKQWCSYDCDCSRGCEQVMLLRWPKTPSASIWSLCDISEHCNERCDDRFTWRYRSSCYYYTSDVYVHSSAEKYCRSLGAELASVETRDEWEYLMLQLRDIGAIAIWLSARLIDGVFKWQSGAELPDNSPLWSPGNPNAGQDCVDMWHRHQYLFGNYYCTGSNQVLCEVKP